MFSTESRNVTAQEKRKQEKKLVSFVRRKQWKMGGRYPDTVTEGNACVSWLGMGQLCVRICMYVVCCVWCVNTGHADMMYNVYIVAIPVSCVYVSSAWCGTCCVWVYISYSVYVYILREERRVNILMLLKMFRKLQKKNFSVKFVLF